VARYGGDEFVVLLHRTTIMAARAALTRMSRAVAALPVEHGRGVTVSVGVAAVRPGESGADALGRADAAMYRAKRAGGNRIRSGGEAGAAVAERVSE
jgi:diguanylate cyclase (GGDEF)-like protein